MLTIFVRKITERGFNWTHSTANHGFPMTVEDDAASTIHSSIFSAESSVPDTALTSGSSVLGNVASVMKLPSAP